MNKKAKEKLLESLDSVCGIGSEGDLARAELAAEILGEVNPSNNNLAAFFAKLPDSVHSELVLRAEEEDFRE